MEVVSGKMNKKIFREYCLKRLKKLNHLHSYKKDKIVLKHLYELVKIRKSKVIFLYLPLKMEVNIYPLILRLRKEKKQLYVPFMEGKSFRLVKYRLPLYPKQFGVKEPKDSKQYRIKNIDLAIVPIVATDASRRRIGFGKGMYDRFFQENHKNVNQVVFVARELCYSQEIVTDYYDVKADMFIAP